MKRTDPQFKIRLPEDLKDRLETLAAREQRSVSAEIVARLQRTLDEDDARAGTPRPEDVAAALGEDEDFARAVAQLGALGQQANDIAKRIRQKAEARIAEAVPAKSTKKRR